MVRTTAIWIFGLIASAIIGAFVGSAYDSTFNPYSMGTSGGGLFGFIGGMCLFACLRLWLAPKSK